MEECIENSSEPIAEQWIRHGHWAQREFVGDFRQADIIVCPTIAEEAHGPTAVEATAVDRLIVASLICGLMFTVLDEVTGLLFKPGDPVDLASQLARLDDRVLRGRIGNAARMHFQHHYTWDVIIVKQYRKLFGPTIREHLER